MTKPRKLSRRMRAPTPPTPTRTKRKRTTNPETVKPSAPNKDDSKSTNMEEITKVHYSQHPAKPNAETLASCHLCQVRSFPTHAEFPITIVNTVPGSDAVIPPHFRFIDRNRIGQGVRPAEKDFRSGCECDADGDCRFTGCLCLEEMLEDDGDNASADADSDDLAGEAKESGRKKVYSYHANGRLRSGALEARMPIYECHSSCSCSADCPNRIVDRGRTIPLEIFRTEDRGWGVRSTIEIREGQFVDTYVGEIITHGEANRRRRDAHIASRKDVYLFALDKFSDEESPDLRLRGPPLEVDGEFLSGPTRFINHSCNPNLRIFARVGDHADKHIHDLAFFAVRNIQAGEELAFDYTDGVTDDDDDAIDPGQVKDMTVCLCGAANCRGFLW